MYFSHNMLPVEGQRNKVQRCAKSRICPVKEREGCDNTNGFCISASNYMKTNEIAIKHAKSAERRGNQQAFFTFAFEEKHI